MIRELPIYQFKSSTQFDIWLEKLDKSIKLRVLARLARVECGNLGDYCFIDDQLAELRIFFGSGIRIYFTFREPNILWLLFGVTKNTQVRDIKQARGILQQLGEQDEKL